MGKSVQSDRLEKSNNLRDKMMYPKISVIIPSFNQGRFILRTIQSIQHQDYPGEIEIIVSDGGSTDETVDVLKSTSGIQWWSAKDNGFADAVNKGLAAATGKILAIQSSDDFYLQGALRKAATALEANPECVLVSGAGLRIDLADNIIDLQEQEPRLIDTPKSMTTGLYLLQHSTFARVDDIRRLGGLRESVDWCADFDLFYRLLHLGHGIIISDHLGVYQVHPLQRTQSHAERWVTNCIKTIEDAERDPLLNQRFCLTTEEKEAYRVGCTLFWNFNIGGVDGVKYCKGFAAQILSRPETPPEVRKVAQEWVAVQNRRERVNPIVGRLTSSLRHNGVLGTTKIGVKRLRRRLGLDSSAFDLNWWSRLV
jgi:hypothetical protein